MSRIQAFTKYKCPNCHTGDIHTKNTVFWFGKMHDNCPACHHKFDKEPGFFFGAMYVSYALTIAEAVGTFIICQFFFTNFFDVWMIPILIGVILLLSGFNYTLSRVVWIYLFTKKGQSATQKR